MYSIKLRRAVPEDSLLLWRWRNDPVTRQMFRNSHRVSWEEHSKWYAKALEDAAKVLLIAQHRDTPLGVLRFDLKERGLTEVSINLAPSVRGQGLGGQLLAKGCQFAFDQLRLEEIHAEINAKNLPSLMIFRRAGFVYQGSKNNMRIYRLARNQFQQQGKHRTYEKGMSK